MKFVNYELGMKTPSDSFKEIGFEGLMADLLAVVEAFNQEFDGERKAKIIHAEKNMLSILVSYLDIALKDKVNKNAKDLLFISKSLYNSHDWKSYTRVEGTLFYLKSVIEILPNEKEELIEKIESYGLPEGMREDILLFYDSEVEDKEGIEYEMEAEEWADVNSVTNEQYIAVFNYLISLSDLDSDTSRARNKALFEIKKQLIQFI